MKYGTYKPNQIVQVSPTGIIRRIAFIKGNGSLGTWSDQDKGYLHLYEGTVYETADDAIASLNVSSTAS